MHGNINGQKIIWKNISYKTELPNGSMRWLS